MPAGAAALRARRRWRGRSARPAPAASLISASRYALGARRTALRAEGAACLCAGLGGAAAGCHRRLALRARRRGRGRCAPGRLRQPFRRLALRARRRRRGRCAPGRLHVVPPPITAHVASWWWGRRRRRALRAARDARCNARFALLPRARVGRGGPDIIMRERSGNACVLPQHVQCASARSAAGIGAPSPQTRPIPRAFSACAPALRAGAVRTGRRCAPALFSREVNMPVRAGSPLGEGVSRIKGEGGSDGGGD